MVSGRGEGWTDGGGFGLVIGLELGGAGIGSIFDDQVYGFSQGDIIIDIWMEQEFRKNV